MRDAERICIPYLYALRIILSLYRLEWGWGLGIHTFISFSMHGERGGLKSANISMCQDFILIFVVSINHSTRRRRTMHV